MKRESSFWIRHVGADAPTAFGIVECRLRGGTMRSKKLVSVLAAVCVMLSAVWPMTAAASDTRRRITSVKITVDD